MKPLTTPQGRPYVVLGVAGVVTMDRLPKIESRLDSDPRIASVSVVYHPAPCQDYLRASAPAGSAIAVALDTDGLVDGLTSELVAQGGA